VQAVVEIALTAGPCSRLKQSACATYETVSATGFGPARRAVIPVRDSRAKVAKVGAVPFAAGALAGTPTPESDTAHERGWIKTKNRAYWRYEMEREGAVKRRRERQLV
jgi:hypothetical protein